LKRNKTYFENKLQKTVVLDDAFPKPILLLKSGKNLAIKFSRYKNGYIGRISFLKVGSKVGPKVGRKWVQILEFWSKMCSKIWSKMYPFFENLVQN